MFPADKKSMCDGPAESALTYFPLGGSLYARVGQKKQGNYVSIRRVGKSGGAKTRLDVKTLVTLDAGQFYRLAKSRPIKAKLMAARVQESSKAEKKTKLAGQNSQQQEPPVERKAKKAGQKAQQQEKSEPVKKKTKRAGQKPPQQQQALKKSPKPPRVQSEIQPAIAAFVESQRRHVARKKSSASLTDDKKQCVAMTQPPSPPPPPPLSPLRSMNTTPTSFTSLPLPTSNLSPTTLTQCVEQTLQGPSVQTLEQTLEGTSECAEQKLEGTSGCTYLGHVDWVNKAGELAGPAENVWPDLWSDKGLWSDSMEPNTFVSPSRVTDRSQRLPVALQNILDQWEATMTSAPETYRPANL